MLGLLQRHQHTFKAVDRVHVSCLVVATVDEGRLGVKTFVSKDGERDFDRPAAAIDKVAVEEHSMCFGRRSCQAEEVQEVVELPMSASNQW